MIGQFNPHDIRLDSSCPPSDDEEVTRYRAHHVQLGIARAGLLAVTSSRLIFWPTRFETNLGAHTWCRELRDIDRIKRSAPEFRLHWFLSGCWHERLCIESGGETIDHFIVRNVGVVEAELRHYLYGEAFPEQPDQHLVMNGLGGQLMAPIHTLMGLLCSLTAVVLSLNHIGHGTWVTTISTLFACFLLVPCFRDLLAFNAPMVTRLITGAAVGSVIIGAWLHFLPPPESPLVIQVLNIFVAASVGTYLSLRCVFHFRGTTSGTGSVSNNDRP